MASGAGAWPRQDSTWRGSSRARAGHGQGRPDTRPPRPGALCASTGGANDGPQGGGEGARPRHGTRKPPTSLPGRPRRPACLLDKHAVAREGQGGLKQQQPSRHCDCIIAVHVLIGLRGGVAVGGRADEIGGKHMQAGVNVGTGVCRNSR